MPPTELTLNERQMADLELLVSGAFHPLKGFMARADYEAVLGDMRLADGAFWPMPICLDVPRALGESLELGQTIILRDHEGLPLARFHLEEIWPINKEKEAAQVYGQADEGHPGVRWLYQNTGGFYLGGQTEPINQSRRFDFKPLRLFPQEVKETFKRRGWPRVVGFIPRHPIHRPQFEATIAAMRQAKANLLILPLVGPALVRGGFDHYTKVRCYKALERYYPPDSFLLALLPLASRLAGAREALWHALIAKNFGCTHFIVGPHHGLPDGLAQAEDRARQVAAEHEADLGLKVVSLEKIVYLPFEDQYLPQSQVRPRTQTVSLSSDDLGERIRTGRKIPDWASYPEVIRELRRAWPPPRKQGFTVFFTGLSGAGKSTIAKALQARLLEQGQRPVTLLDGDIVRRHLSSDLSFSKEHRDLNIRRLGFVASEITKNRGIAICAPIAPYRQTRDEVRAMVEQYGGFILVHVATPLWVCEARDPKGMYAKARAGLIKGFTGLDDPYEPPEAPEVVVETTDLSPDEAAQEVMLFLGQRGLV